METKKKLAEEFEMKDLGLMHYFLGLEVLQSSEGIFLNQGKYAVEILKILKMLDDDSSELVDATHYRQIIGSLMYLTNTSPDICFAVSSTQTGSLGSCKTRDEISERDYRFWSIL